MKEERNELENSPIDLKLMVKEIKSRAISSIIFLILLISFYTISLVIITIFATDDVSLGWLLIILMIAILTNSFISYSKVKDLAKLATQLTKYYDDGFNVIKNEGFDEFIDIIEK